MSINPEEFNALREDIQDIKKMMRGMNRKNRMQNIGGVLRSVALLAGIIALIFILQPYLKQAREIYSSVSENLQKIQDTASGLEGRVNDTQAVLEDITGEIDITENQKNGLWNFFNNNNNDDVINEGEAGQ